MRALAADRETFLVGQARLFDVNIHIPHGLGDAHRLVLDPAGVGVRDKSVARLKLCRHREDARDIHIRIAADLELEARVALGPIACDLRGHFIRRFLGNGPVEAHVLTVAPTHQFAHRHAGAFPKNVPTGDIDAAFDIGMALQGRVHAVIQFRQLTRVLAQ